RPVVQETLRTVAQALLDPAAPADFNQAIMELGATVCTPRGPQCLVCPVRTPCHAAAQGDPTAYPVKERVAPTEIAETVAIVQALDIATPRWLCEEIPTGQRNAGLWRFPHFDPDTMLGGAAELCAFTYGITKYRVRLRAIHAALASSVASAISSSSLLSEATDSASVIREDCAPVRLVTPPPPGMRWLSAADIDELPFASAHRKIATLLLKG
ncbi:MAG TPA: hypothetical protein VK970_24240, partial [Candidatus Methylacidiphilales bacterium]|nr:hypothetical protein [Candidatus Methylacidiphilales bacterium]